MCARFVVEGSVSVLLVALLQPVGASAQVAAAPVATQAVRLSMADAVRLALDRNQTLRAQRLTIDASKADAITAGLKPNPTVSFGVGGLSVFNPSQLTFSTANSGVAYDAGLNYTFELGGKRAKRLTVADDTVAVATAGVLDAERQVRFQTEQTFIAVLLARSTLDVARQNLQNFADFVDISQQRVTSGDLAEADFLPIAIQKLQFETDVSAAEVGLVQARAALRQLVGFDSVPDDFDVAGELATAAPAVGLDDLKREALVSRPDLQAARSGVKAAQDAAALERGNRARDVNGGVDYTKASGSNTLGVGVSFDLPIHDRNQGNIAHADVVVRQATETEAATRFLVSDRRGERVRRVPIERERRQVVRIGLPGSGSPFARDHALRVSARRQ